MKEDEKVSRRKSLKKIPTYMHQIQTVSVFLVHTLSFYAKGGK